MLQMVGTWKRPAASLERLRAQYGKRITVQLPFSPPFVILSDPEEIKELLTAPPDAVHPGEGARILEPIVGSNSVILLDEHAHLEQRRLLLPAFHGERMQALSGLIGQLARGEIATWPTGEPVALHPRLQRVTLEIILRAVFGLEQGRRLDELRDALTRVLEFSTSPLSVIQGSLERLRFLPQVREFKRLRARADELIFEQIEERREKVSGPEDGDGRRSDVLAMLLAARHEDGSEMSPQELRDELMTALVAGHETTASQLAWGLAQIARDRQVAERLRSEIDAGETDEYLTATIHEILRLRPVLPNAEPRLTKREITIGGYTYPPGVALLASAYLVHHDPEIYPDPYAFRPERFVGEAQPDDAGAARSGDPGRRAGGKPGTYTWLPFGGGRRRCLGASFAMLEMKIVLRETLARFNLSVVPGSKPEVTARRSITFSPARGCEVVLTPRRDERAGSRTAEPGAASLAAAA
jgi:cytochrome P450